MERAEQVAAVLALIESWGDPELDSVPPSVTRARRRARLEAPTVDVHDVRDLDADGVPTRLYRPSAAEGLGLFVYFHGGGWVFGDLDTHDHLSRSLAVAIGHAVLAVDYRVAPEHPFPAALEDAVTAVGWAYRNAEQLGLDPGRIAIGGDSAGGNLAAVVSQNSIAPLRFQLLVYPVTDAVTERASRVEHREAPILTAAEMDWFFAQYLSGDEGAPDDPRISPILADDNALAASPPTLVITAELDPLRDEGEAYAERLRAVGVPARVTRYDGMFHGFLRDADLLDDGRAALDEAAAALRAALR